MLYKVERAGAEISSKLDSRGKIILITLFLIDFDEFE